MPTANFTRNLSFSLSARYSNRFGAGYVGKATLIWERPGSPPRTILAQTRLEGASLALALRYRLTGRRKDAAETPLLK